MLSGSDFEKAQDNSLLLQSQREAAWRWVKQSLGQRRRAWSFLGRRILMKRSVVSRSSPRRAGFSLLEVMVATSVLVVGALLVSQAFFVNAEGAARADVRLAVGFWMDEKMSESVREWREAGRAFVSPDRGAFVMDQRSYTWERSARATASDIDRIDLGVVWSEGARERSAGLTTCLIPS